MGNYHTYLEDYTYSPPLSELHIVILPVGYAFVIISASCTHISVPYNGKAEVDKAPLLIIFSGETFYYNS